MANKDNYANGIVTADSLYELRINGKPVEQSANVVDLYWKARRAVNGTTDKADVEAVKGFYVHALFADALLHPWERAA